MTFLHITSCPMDYCQWNTLTLLCEDRQACDNFPRCFDSSPCPQGSRYANGVLERQRRPPTTLQQFLH